MLTYLCVRTFATIFSAMFECLPVDSNWILSEFGTRKCVNRPDQQYATSALSFTTDIAILILPMKYLIRTCGCSLFADKANMSFRAPHFHTRKDPSDCIDVIGYFVSNVNISYSSHH